MAPAWRQVPCRRCSTRRVPVAPWPPAAGQRLQASGGRGRERAGGGEMQRCFCPGTGHRPPLPSPCIARMKHFLHRSDSSAWMTWLSAPGAGTVVALAWHHEVCEGRRRSAPFGLCSAVLPKISANWFMQRSARHRTACCALQREAGSVRHAGTWHNHRPAPTIPAASLPRAGLQVHAPKLARPLTPLLP